jgi:UDP-N-acetylglucosamine acyltransferase
VSNIHATAIIGSGAKLGNNVTVGPYCVVGDGVTLHDDVILRSHVCVDGQTTIGAGTSIYPFASIGQPAQIYKAPPAATGVEIGSGCEIREHVTINCGSSRGDGFTRIGKDCMLMVGAHVAHDCTVGERVIFANNATLAGHVVVGDQVFLGGLCAVHQFARIGEQAMIGGVTGVEGDVIPHGLVMGDRAVLKGLNLVGLKRRGFTRDQIHNLRNAYMDLFHGDGIFADRLESVAVSYADNETVQKIVTFVRGAEKRSLVMP